MEPGPSSVISKAVVEEFAPRFLKEPGVIWLSESRNQVAPRDDRLAWDIGLTIRQDKNLPDLILVDIGPSEPLLVFVEVVATAGPVTSARQNCADDDCDGGRVQGRTRRLCNRICGPR